MTFFRGVIVFIAYNYFSKFLTKKDKNKNMFTREIFIYIIL